MNFYDLAYSTGVAAAAPYWLIAPKARKKVLSALRDRMGHVRSRDVSRPAVMIHAVSLGEINATRSLVSKLRAAKPELQFIVSTTTETGFSRGRELYGNDPDIFLIRYPLDFSAAVERMLEALKPSVVVLMELELWPNFLRQCQRRKVPVVLVNGRLTSYSFKRYRWVKGIAAAMLKNVKAICVQDETYAQRFAELGADEEKIHVTGTMKFDTAQVGTSVEGADDLAREVGLSGSGTSVPLWVCGSTGPGEEEICSKSYRDLLSTFPDLRLAIIPRHPQRFDEVAAQIAACGFALVRRSAKSPGSKEAIVLGDTMGELRKFYSLASVVFVGRTLVDLGPRQHGSDMIEPAALGKPTIVGPYTGNFAEVMNRLREKTAIVEVANADELREAVKRLLEHPQAIGERAQQVVIEQKGATDRHVQIILAQLAVQ